MFFPHSKRAHNNSCSTMDWTRDLSLTNQNSLCLKSCCWNKSKGNKGSQDKLYNGATVGKWPTTFCCSWHSPNSCPFWAFIIQLLLCFCKIPSLYFQYILFKLLFNDYFSLFATREIHLEQLEYIIFRNAIQLPG